MCAKTPPPHHDSDPVDGFCRDCFCLTNKARCPQCFSPRVVRHSDIFSLSIAHVDCDAFYASVEKRDNPALRDKPVIVGGAQRGVVTTACYLARMSGVHSAMPMFLARRACPQAVVIRPDMKKYARVSRQIREKMRHLSPLVEAVSIDEAYLDLGGTRRLHGSAPAVQLARLAQEIERDLGISISIGLGVNKLLAKCASDLNKPRGFSIIGGNEAMAFLHDKPVGFMRGVGIAMQRRLKRDGLHRLGQLQTMSQRELAQRYGAMGLTLYHRARGIDTSRVRPERGVKSISSETTFGKDICKGRDLQKRLRRLSEAVSTRLKKRDLAGQSVTLKLKTATFQTLTRSRKLHCPTQLADRIYTQGAALLAGELNGTAYRLIGIGVSNLTHARFADPDDLVDSGFAKRAEVERAVDRIRARFGRDAVGTGLTFVPSEPAKS